MIDFPKWQLLGIQACRYKNSACMRFHAWTQSPLAFRVEPHGIAKMITSAEEVEDSVISFVRSVL